MTTFCTILSKKPKSIRSEILTDDYDPFTPPSNNQIHILLSFAVLGIVEVNTVDSYAVIAGYVKHRWTDPRLQWDPLEHGGEETVRINTNPDVGPFIWQPDINIYERNEQDNGFPLAQVNYTGEVYWSRLGHYELNVNFILDDYPFDEQDIQMSLESWSYTSDKIYLECDKQDPIKIINDSFVANVEWEVTDQKEWNELKQYYTGEYSRVVFMLHIERQGQTIKKTVIFPALFVTCLAFFYYFIPIGTGARTGYLATILLTVIMFLVMLTTFVPVSKRTTGIVDMFFNLTVILFCLSIVVLFMDWYHNVIIQDEKRNEVKDDKAMKLIVDDEEGENNINTSQVEEKEKITTTIKKCMTLKRVLLLDKIVAAVSSFGYIIVVIFYMTAHDLFA